MIQQSFIDDLLARADIVSVIDRRVPLKKTGANFSACCPFHQEKSPSFTVSPSKQFYHCFGCGAHGNAIGFLMAYQGLGFVDAVKQLAGEFGMSLPEPSFEAQEKTKSSHPVLEIMTLACQYYRTQLKADEAAISYLKQRGLTGEVAGKFGIGYAPDAWQGLASVVSDYASNTALLAAGLVIDNEQGRRYDRFRGRIMFPIIGQNSAVIGFGGRVMGAGEPKYLNSPETVVFAKGRELYGLFQARDAIRRQGYVLVVEGYMDVVALAQYGIDYAVATLGTATTPEHVEKLLRVSERIVFCFDGDNAGRKAAWRALENALPLLTDAVRLEFLFLPDGEDPDSLIRREGALQFAERINAEAEPLSRFLLRQLSSLVDMKSAEGRARLNHLARPLLDRIAAPTLKVLLKDELRNMTRAFSVNRRVDRKWDKVQPSAAEGVRTAPLGFLERLQILLLCYPATFAVISGDDRQVYASILDAAGGALLDVLRQSPNLNELSFAQICALCPEHAEAWQRLLRRPREGLSALDLNGAQLEVAALRHEIVQLGLRREGQARLNRLSSKIASVGLSGLDAADRKEYISLLRGGEG